MQTLRYRTHSAPAVMNVRHNTRALLLLLLLAPAAAHVNSQTQAAFEEVYRTRRWEPRHIVKWEGKQGGGSGTGSSVEFTVPLRRLLQRFVACLLYTSPSPRDS